MSTGTSSRRGRAPARTADVRAARLVTLLLRLNTGAPTTAAELAAEVGVAVRTVYRDLADLQAAGFPLWTGTGPGGGVRMADGWTSRFAGMTDEEASALLLQVTPTTAGPLGLAATAARHRKAVPPDVEARAAALAERCLLDAPGWFRRPDAVPHLATLSCALWDDHRVTVASSLGNGEAPHAVDPLGLVLRSGRWYLVAAADGTPRSYRVSRITEAAIDEAPVQRPAGFVLAGWWTDSAAQLDGAPTPH